MSSLGTASLALSVKGQQFDNGLKQTEKQAEGWASRVSSKIKGVGGKLVDGLTKGLGAGVGFALGQLGIDSIGNVLSKGVEKLKELKDIGQTAETLGIGGEQFSKLAAGMKAFGFDVAGVSDLLTDLSDKVYDAAVNGGEAAETLTLMGINAKELQGLPLPEMLAKVADGIKGIKDPGEAAGLTVRLLSDNGLKLLPVLRQGADGINALGEGMGHTNNEIAQATVAAESFEIANAKLEQVAGKVAVAFAPVVSIIADQLVEAINGGQNSFSQFGSAVIPVVKNVAYFIANIVDVMRGLGNVIKFSISGWKALGGVIWETIGKATGNKQQEAEGKALFKQAEQEGMEAFNELKDHAWDVTNALGGILDMKLDQFDQKVAKIEKRLANPPKPNRNDIKQAEELAVKPYEAIIAGSKEAARAMLRWNAGIPLEDVPKAQLNEAKKHTQQLKDISQNIKGQKMVLGKV